MPTPNLGLKAAALQTVRLAVRILENTLPKLGVASDEGKDVMKALSILAKHIPPDAASPGIEQSAITQQQLQARQEAPMLQMLRQAQSGGAAGPGAQPGSAGPAGQPPAAQAA